MALLDLRLRTVLKVVAAAFVLSGLCCAYAEIPAPTGSYRVGRMTVCWADQSRMERNTATGNEVPRTVLAALFYPVSVLKGENSGTISYIPEIDRLPSVFGEEKLRTELGMSYTEAAKVRIVADATPTLPAQHKHPLLLFLPGLMHGSFRYSTQLLELASHGYVVAAVNPPGEVSGFACPAGQVVPRDMSGRAGAQQKPGLEAAHSLFLAC